MAKRHQIYYIAPVYISPAEKVELFYDSQNTFITNIGIQAPSGTKFRITYKDNTETYIMIGFFKSVSYEDVEIKKITLEEAIANALIQIDYELANE